MAIVDLYSKRQKRLRGEVPDVYQYTDLPSAFRSQVVHIFHDLLGNPHGHYSPTNEFCKGIHDAIAREHGIVPGYSINKRQISHRTDYRHELCDYLLAAPDIDHAFDVIELTMRAAKQFRQVRNFQYAEVNTKFENGVAELNQRFEEHGIGFQFESGEIIQVDSKVIHQEVVKPTLLLLSAQRFAGANDEFLKAHEHYRHGRYPEAMNECLKAFESVMKVICKDRKWQVSDTATAKDLIKAVFDNGLLPTYLQSEFTGLRTTLESGVPTARNRESGHGQGATVKTVPQHVAAYALHLTAANILFLAEADKALS
jgi:uncharacterized protein DUF7014/AbiJ-like protein